MMIGGRRETLERLDPIFKTLAPGRGTIPPTPGREGRDPSVEEGYLYAGPCGAGHFVKMVHNGVEYGLMQAYAEGFDILRNADAPTVDAGASLHLRRRRHRRSVAARQRRLVVAARPHGERAGARGASSNPIPAMSRIRARAAGRCRRRSTRRCRPRCCRPRSTRASARARSTLSPRRSSRRCARASAGMWSPRSRDAPRALSVLRRRPVLRLACFAGGSG